MKTSKHLLLAAAFVLLAGVSAVMAQSKAGSGNWVPPEPILPSVHVNAIEVTDGTVGYDSLTKEETAFGYAFLGRTTGSFPGSFTMSMNCAPAKAVPGQASNLTGGAWTLPVYLIGPKFTGYAGSLYGRLDKGVMYWDKTGTNANVTIVLSVDGGTQSWEGAAGYAIFTGLLSVDEKTGETTLSGDMEFDLRIVMK